METCLRKPIINDLIFCLFAMTTSCHVLIKLRACRPVKLECVPLPRGVQEEPVHSDRLPLFVPSSLCACHIFCNKSNYTCKATDVKWMFLHPVFYPVHCYFSFLSFRQFILICIVSLFSVSLCLFLSHCIAQSKSVSWLLGCDGDVQVIVIGEMDEFKSSKILRSGLGERKPASLHNNSQYGHVSISFCLTAAHSILMC